MKINFGEKSENNFSIESGSFEYFLKTRAKKLSELQDAINEILKDYDGGLVAIVVMKEDEDGLPSGKQMFLGGVSRPETQLMMSKALGDASRKAIELLLEAVKKDPEQVVTITGQLLNFMENKLERESK